MLRWPSLRWRCWSALWPVPPLTRGQPSSTTSSSYSAPAYSQEAPQSSYQAPPSATTFQDYGRSDFVATVEDSVSTFSLDTDRTSYQLALNWARDGLHGGPRLRTRGGVDQRLQLRLLAPGADRQLCHHRGRHPAPPRRRDAPGAPRLPGARVPGRRAAQCDPCPGRLRQHGGRQPRRHRPHRGGDHSPQPAQRRPSRCRALR